MSTVKNPKVVLLDGDVNLGTYFKNKLHFDKFNLTPTCTSVFQNIETKNILGKCHFGRRNIGTDPR